MNTEMVNTLGFYDINELHSPQAYNDKYSGNSQIIFPV